MMTVNADAPPIDVHLLDYPDKEINELGARGIGEIGLAGVAAAISDAVHHAPGVRVRKLPVKIENLISWSLAFLLRATPAAATSNASLRLSVKDRPRLRSSITTEGSMVYGPCLLRGTCPSPGARFSGMHRADN